MQIFCSEMALWQWDLCVTVIKLSKIWPINSRLFHQISDHRLKSFITLTPGCKQFLCQLWQRLSRWKRLEVARKVAVYETDERTTRWRWCKPVQRWKEKCTSGYECNKCTTSPPPKSSSYAPLVRSPGVGGRKTVSANGDRLKSSVVKKWDKRLRRRTQAK
jgi:hypothetical protein